MEVVFFIEIPIDVANSNMETFFLLLYQLDLLIKRTDNISFSLSYLSFELAIEVKGKGTVGDVYNKALGQLKTLCKKAEKDSMLKEFDFLKSK